MTASNPPSPLLFLFVPKGKKSKTNVVTHYKFSLKSDVIALFVIVMTRIKCTRIKTIAMTCINVL